MTRCDLCWGEHLTTEHRNLRMAEHELEERLEAQAIPIYLERRWGPKPAKEMLKEGSTHWFSERDWTAIYEIVLDLKNGPVFEC